MSRWTIPWSCATASASATTPAIATASSGGNGPSAMRSLERPPRHEVHDQRRSIRVVDQAARADDRRVVDGAQRLGLALEPRPSDRVGHDVRMELLDRDDLARPLVPGAPDRGHPARRVPVQKRVSVADPCLVHQMSASHPMRRPLVHHSEEPCKAIPKSGPAMGRAAMCQHRSVPDDRPAPAIELRQRRIPGGPRGPLRAQPAHPRPDRRSRRASARPAPAR